MTSAVRPLRALGAGLTLLLCSATWAPAARHPLELKPADPTLLLAPAGEHAIIPLPLEEAGLRRGSGIEPAAAAAPPRLRPESGAAASASHGVLPAVPKLSGEEPQVLEEPGRGLPPPSTPRLHQPKPWEMAARRPERVCRSCGPLRPASRPGALPPLSHPETPRALSLPGDAIPAPAVEDEREEPAAPPRRLVDFIMPFAHGRVTSLFNQGRRHPAIDLAGRLGTPVLATTAGQVVVFAGWRGGYGNTVIARDPFGRTHLYGHLQKIVARVGQALEQGTRLGLLGSTGRSTGPHVHYEVRDARGSHIDPVTLLFPGRRVAKGYAWIDVYQERATAERRLAAAQPRPR